MKDIFVIFSIVILVSCSTSSSREESGKRDEYFLNDDSVEKTKEDNHNSEPVIKVDAKKIIPEGRCDLNMILKTDENIDQLSTEDIYFFLYTFSKYCKNNVEFGEYSNEILFKVLVRYTDFVSNNLGKDSINRDIILEELASPVIEIESMDEVIKAVERLEVTEAEKGNIVEELKKVMY